VTTEAACRVIIFASDALPALNDQKGRSHSQNGPPLPRVRPVGMRHSRSLAERRDSGAWRMGIPLARETVQGPSDIRRSKRRKVRARVFRIGTGASVSGTSPLINA
jgi:hypothetical protein